VTESFYNMKRGRCYGNPRIAPGRCGETYRLRLGAKVFNVTNHFNPRDNQGNLASEEFGGFSNGVGRRFRLKFVIERK
jgi:hypothetical protein